MGSGAEMDQLILKRAAASRPSGEWNDDDFDVLADGVVVGRIMKAAASPGSGPISEADEVIYSSSPEKMLDLLAAVVGDAPVKSVFELNKALERVRTLAPSLAH